METEEKVTENALEGTSIGTVKIANDVVATIAGLAAADAEGIAGMSGGVAGGIAEMLGRKNLTKGVKVEVGDTDATIDIYHALCELTARFRNTSAIYHART